MLRPRIAVPVVLVVAAVAAAGVAAATHHTKSIQAAAADFAAGSISQSHTDTCTATDGTYQLTTATYTGTATSSDPRLNGSVEIRASSVVNTTTNLGWLDGTLRIHGTNTGTNGRIHAAIANGAAEVEIISGSLPVTLVYKGHGGVVRGSRTKVSWTETPVYAVTRSSLHPSSIRCR